MDGSIFVTGAIAFFFAGTAFGFWLSRRSRKQSPSEYGYDRQAVLKLLAELEYWAHHYSDDVAEHRALLESLTSAAGKDSLTNEQVVAVLQQSMKNNEKLRANLQIAERVLEEKSLQIKRFLNEARTDSLTGLANRRAFDERLEELFAEHRRGGRCFTVALIDVDHFKLVNDTHGHVAGDRLLRSFALSLRDQLPDALQVARIGGEEFAVILGQSLRESAESVDRLHKSRRR